MSSHCYSRCAQPLLQAPSIPSYPLALVLADLDAMRDVKDMGQQMGYRSLEWNWPKEAMNRPIWAGIVDGAKLF